MAFPSDDTLTISKELLQSVCNAFGLGRMTSHSPLPGTRNRNFKVIVGGSSWVLRQRYKGYSKEQRIRFDHAAARFLAQQRVPVLPPLPTPDGKGYVRVEGSVWEAYRFVEGRPLSEGNKEDLTALGVALARFHRVGADFPLRLSKLAPRGETDPGLLRKLADHIAEETAEAVSALAPYRDWMALALQELPDTCFGPLPHTLNHGDIQPANLFMKKGRINAFLDLDWCLWQPRIYDLAYALLFCCANHETQIEGGSIWSLTQPPTWTVESVPAFLSAYEYGWQPLSNEEHSALKAQMLLTWCHCRLAGALKVEAKDRKDFLARPPHTSEDLMGAVGW
jgi:Ser/Thr protein kinase RdoA (MazF antagonist)